MASMSSRGSDPGDERNTAFGLPAQMMARKSGLNREVAQQEDETGTDDRLRPSAAKDIPQESLAVRIAKSRQEGERS